MPRYRTHSRRGKDGESIFTGRRKLLVAAGATGLAAIAAGGTWWLRGRETTENWSSLSAYDRINSLELKQTPQTLNFDQRQELIKATSEFLCEQLDSCPGGPNELAQNVTHVDTNTFLAFAQDEVKAKGRTWVPEDETFFKNAAELVTQDGKVVFNEPILKQVTNNASAKPELTDQMSGHDGGVVIEKGILFHAFAHVLETKAEVFLPSPIKLGSGITLSHMKGFDFIGEDEKGEPYLINGLREVSAEYIARHLATRSGGYFISISGYKDGLSVLDETNKALRIEPEEYISYFLQPPPEKSFDKLIALYSEHRSSEYSQDNQAGAYALLAIAAAGQRLMDYQQSKKLVSEFLNLNQK